VTEDIQPSTGQPTAENSPGTAGGPSAQASTAAGLQERAVSLADQRPEVAVGAAFAGGLLLAMILKRLGR
jgi:hypothetical protein